MNFGTPLYGHRPLVVLLPNPNYSVALHPVVPHLNFVPPLGHLLADLSHHASHLLEDLRLTVVVHHSSYFVLLLLHQSYSVVLRHCVFVMVYLRVLLLALQLLQQQFLSPWIDCFLLLLLLQHQTVSSLHQIS